MFMRQIAYLIALDKHRHFGRAAESCHVSQPALSAAISEMERELGITIVKRNRSFQGITPEGERVIAWARQVQASLHGLQQEAALVRSVPGGHLAIGTIPTAVQATTLLTAEYRRLVPALTLDIQSLSTSEILRRLQKQDIDFAITYPPAEDLGIFDIRILYVERYVLIAHRDRMLPATLSWQQIADLPLTLLSQDMQSRKMLDGVFARLGLRVRAVVESNAVRVLHEEAVSGRSVSVIPLSALPRHSSDDALRIHAILPEHKADVALMRLRRAQQSALSDLAWGAASAGDLQAVLDRPLTVQS